MGNVPLKTIFLNLALEADCGRCNAVRLRFDSSDVARNFMAAVAAMAVTEVGIVVVVVVVDFDGNLHTLFTMRLRRPDDELYRSLVVLTLSTSVSSTFDNLFLIGTSLSYGFGK